MFINKIYFDLILFYSNFLKPSVDDLWQNYIKEYYLEEVIQ